MSLPGLSFGKNFKKLELDQMQPIVEVENEDDEKSKIDAKKSEIDK